MHRNIALGSGTRIHLLQRRKWTTGRRSGKKRRKPRRRVKTVMGEVAAEGRRLVTVLVEEVGPGRVFQKSGWLLDCGNMSREQFER
jgi:hypothetical protein